jgi:hypothetical protein
MSKASLVAIAVFALICGIGWIITWHLTGWAVVVIIGLPLVLGALSLTSGEGE